jgi:hypothetical protein
MSLPSIDDIVDAMVRDSQESQKDKCCLQPSWRGHLCQYHQGYEDGADAALRMAERAKS